MSIDAKQVKELREKTGAGMMDCKKALVECEGNFDNAVDFLRKKGLAAAAKKAGRTTSEGMIGSYIHANGKIGVLVEVACETDFVAKTEDFQNFVKDVSMHIAATAPVCVSEEDMPQAFIEKEREIIRGQIAEDPKMAGKPAEMVDKIVEGKIKKIYTEQCLMNQKFVKDPDVTIAQYLSSIVGKLGENMSVARFARFNLGEKA